METFTSARPFTLHPGYASDRDKTNRELEEEMLSGSIDAPLLPIIRDWMPITHCFTVQCCFGHFVHDREPDIENLVPPSRYRGKIETVRYRLAYVAVCIQDTICGREMYADLEELAADNPDYIQFGSAGWFWERLVNTYCIQLEPERLKNTDSGLIAMDEALHLEMLRKNFFQRLAGIVQKHRRYAPLLTESDRPG
jgi:hypothetical protein